MPDHDPDEHFVILPDGVTVDDQSNGTSDDDDDDDDDRGDSSSDESLPDQGGEYTAFDPGSMEGIALDPAALVLASDLLPERLVVLPNVHRPFFPGMFLPVTLSERSQKAVELAVKHYRGHLGILLAKGAAKDPEAVSGFDDLHEVGVVARVVNLRPLSPGVTQAFMQVVKRFRLKRRVSESPLLVAEVDYIEEPDAPKTQHFKAMVLAVVAETKALIDENPNYGEELKLVVNRFSGDQPGMLADLTSALTSASRGEVQEILESVALEPRLEKALLLLKNERNLVQLRNKISKQIQERISEKQREFLLHEQLKEIRRELGLDKDPSETLQATVAEALKGKTLPEEVKKVIDEELERVTSSDPRAPDYAIHRTYLDWLVALPWGVRSRKRTSLKRAKKVLDRDHYGMEDVKDRILEFIAVQTLKTDTFGSILLLVGPPGVGKTSIGRAVAEALGRKFYRFSVGGMRDEAEIKGHRRTYIGAMPGKLAQALKTTEVQNPVLMIDEIDKLAVGYQGDPAAALLEVLDPAQNTGFLDHYLDVRLDLSQVLFVCTANQVDTIPRPLLDRMEIIEVSGYLDVEKVEIARRYLLPEQREAHGLAAADLSVSRPALERAVSHYAREAGVRGLQKAMARICRKAARKKAEGHEGKVRVTATNLEKFLGRPQIEEQELHIEGQPGVVRGLAYTAMGGATLFIEATAIPAPGKGGLKTTGKLGDVMTESVSIAYTWARGHVAATGADATFFEDHQVHVHVPAGATPKDGPSAGVAMATALLSLASGRPVRAGLAMTGELSLTGQVLPVGGIREKCMAAHRMGVRDILLPAQNRRDVEELPKSLKDDLTFRLVAKVDEVWPWALEAAGMMPKGG